MPTIAADDLRNMKPLRTENHTLGQPEQTLAMLEEDGYVYFRNVLDQGAVGRLKQHYMDVLVDWGFVDADVREPPFRLEITEYRISSPVTLSPGPHQDAFYNKGMECFTCWVPLMEIDERTGGLIIPISRTSLT